MRTPDLRTLDPDGVLLFGTRVVRMFAYGFLSVVLALYLVQVGLSETQIGLVFSLTLLGDAGVSLWMTTWADRVGRRRMLVLGSLLMCFAGIVFAFTSNMAILALAAIVGVISPSGMEIGPFLSIEQAALTQIVRDEQRTHVFAWYSLVGSFATALGALGGGTLAQTLQIGGMAPVQSFRLVVLVYAGLGLVLGLGFMRLTPAIEVTARASRGRATTLTAHFGLHRSGGVVLKLSALFALDAFAGGFVVQSLLAYWFSVRFGVEPAILGGIFFGANIMSGLSALVAARVAARIGLINTMVVTHLPSSLFLILLPLMPTLPLAIAVLVGRAAIAQMDVPTRQSYTMAVVGPDERSAASGVTTIARSLGAALSPSLAGLLFGASLVNVPFFLAGGLKVVYDLALYINFRMEKPPEERRGTALPSEEMPRVR